MFQRRSIAINFNLYSFFCNARQNVTIVCLSDAKIIGLDPKICANLSLFRLSFFAFPENTNHTQNHTEPLMACIIPIRDGRAVK